jgi:hypothetical protein
MAMLENKFQETENEIKEIQVGKIIYNMNYRP